ncbi:DNA-protecting protein DprA [Kluyvera genomosp. 1]|uniref:DNA-protecting protein DprA n=1 Tax=Kluyvera genomosp. 1 TaxID=2774053 RepID=UPI00068CDB33|nr:DNA-protecting protein DprA [Kluyvera genomosp. 1]
MSPEEVAFRLLKVNNLCGDEMLHLLRILCQQAIITRHTLSALGLSGKQAQRFFSFTSAEQDAADRWLALPDSTLLLADSPLYPEPLKAIRDYPAVLCVRGNVHLLSSLQIAVVGSRQHSLYGERWGRYFCQALAKHSITITSGLALGIDGVAHRGALEIGSGTIAVLGSGLNHIYPHRHRALAEEIVAKGGALVSEFSLAATPMAFHFPRRNRIISGLSHGVLVVEAALRSGSLVTARCALEQGREVFAIPGPLGHPGMEGPHWLIKQGAVMVTEAEDILAQFPSLNRPLSVSAGMANYCADKESVALPFPELLANVGDEATPVDVVAERAGQPVPVIVAQLLELELAGWIAAVPGGYVRLRRAGHVRRTNVFV